MESAIHDEKKEKDKEIDSSTESRTDEVLHHIEENMLVGDENVHIGWRSWVVVFVTCFAIFAQVFVVVAAGSVIAFIIRDLGQPELAGWIIQGPLLMQSVLSPIVGRLSDVLDRKYLASIPPIIAFVGAVISAKATSMNMLIGGGILIGITLSTIAIVQAIPSEVLPMKHRALANGFAFIAGNLGGIAGTLGAGGVTNINPSGWRSIFWMQAAFHLATSLGIYFFYWPTRRSDFPKMSIKQLVWACDPIGSSAFVISATLMLLALDWAGGTFPFSDPHVAVPLAVGLFFLVVFCLYEWKGRSDGLLAHVFFRGSPNFLLSIFAFAVEGWIFYSAVNSITPQIILNLGFETSAWIISLRQLVFQGTAFFASIAVTWYSTKYKDLRSPLLVTFGLFLVSCILYTTIRPTDTFNRAQLGYNVITGVGQAGPLTLIPALVQFTAPHAFLSTATGLAFSARAIGGAYGSAILDAIINGHLTSTYASAVTSAATNAGLPSSSVSALLAALAAGTPLSAVPGTNQTIIDAAMSASEQVYARAYNLSWASIIPFVVLAIVAIACLKGVRELMTDRVEATVEHIDRLTDAEGENI